MLRSWHFLNHGEERIKPILCHPEFISGSSHSKTLGSTQKEKVVASSMGQMLKRVQHNIMWGRKAAFTLAEVLITLGIIGVVAALTLPTLIQNYQKRVYVTQLKKSVSVLSNGFKLMMAHDGVTELKDTHAFSDMSGNNPAFNNAGTPDRCDYSNILTNDCRSIREGLQSVFSGIQFVQRDATQIKFLNGSAVPNTFAPAKQARTYIVFPDGLEIYNYGFYKGLSSSDGLATYYGYLYVDLNGPKNPNTFGRDIFMFNLYNTGVVMPYGTCTEGADKCWRTATNSIYKCDTSSRGMTCAARVLEEDAMNY